MSENRRIFEDQLTQTKHSIARTQQRNIPEFIQKLLKHFGQTRHVGDGHVLHYFERNSRHRVRQFLGGDIYRRLHEFWDAYLVEAGGVLVSTGHRFKRIRTK